MDFAEAHCATSSVLDLKAWVTEIWVFPVDVNVCKPRWTKEVHRSWLFYWMSGDWETRTDSRSVITLWSWGCAPAACCHWANCDLVWLFWANGCFHVQSWWGFFSPGTQVAPEELVKGLASGAVCSLWPEITACHRAPAVSRVMHRRRSPQDSIFRYHRCYLIFQKYLVHLGYEGFGFGVFVCFL